MDFKLSARPMDLRRESTFVPFEIVTLGKSAFVSEFM